MRDMKASVRAARRGSDDVRSSGKGLDVVGDVHEHEHGKGLKIRKSTSFSPDVGATSRSGVSQAQLQDK